MANSQQLNFFDELETTSPTGRTQPEALPLTDQENLQDEDLSKIAISLQTADGQPLSDIATIPPELLLKALKSCPVTNAIIEAQRSLRPEDRLRADVVGNIVGQMPRHYKFQEKDYGFSEAMMLAAFAYTGSGITLDVVDTRVVYNLAIHHDNPWSNFARFNKAFCVVGRYPYPKTVLEQRDLFFPGVYEEYGDTYDDTLDYTITVLPNLINPSDQHTTPSRSSVTWPDKKNEDDAFQRYVQFFRFDRIWIEDDRVLFPVAFGDPTQNTKSVLDRAIENGSVGVYDPNSGIYIPNVFPTVALLGRILRR